VAKSKIEDAPVTTIAVSTSAAAPPSWSRGADRKPEPDRDALLEAVDAGLLVLQPGAADPGHIARPCWRSCATNRAASGCGRRVLLVSRAAEQPQARCGRALPGLRNLSGGHAVTGGRRTVEQECLLTSGDGVDGKRWSSTCAPPGGHRRQRLHRGIPARHQS